jgi:GDP-4-dehydro-6-deoxy-D-mannose reductase
VTGLPLITGATGFAGGHLLRQLSAEGPVHAWSNPAGRHAARTGQINGVSWRAVDLLDRQAVERAIDDIRPAVIYHCAGVADVHAAWQAPGRVLQVNVMSTHNLLEAAAQTGVERVLVTSSALVYRQSTDAVDEDHPIGPTTPYGVSKVAQEMTALASSVAVLIARPFNHAGPGQEDAYVTSAFARQVAEIEAGRAEPVLRVGNLDSRRDITDVRDTVKAYRTVVARGTPRRPYNVCRGTAYRIADLLDILLSLARVKVRVEQDPARLRPSDNPVVLGNHDRITAETGWAPEITIEQTLSDLLDDWRRRVASA